MTAAPTSRTGVIAAAIGLSCIGALACGARPGCEALACAAACPRDSARDAAGRCVCLSETVPVLGACVPPAVGDAYCGAAAILGAQGCVFRRCGSDERLDAVTGRCIAANMVVPSAARCSEGARPIVAQKRPVCVAGDISCPRGTHRATGAAGPVCLRPPNCPSGSLPVGGGCRSVVTAGANGGPPRVDVGAWASVVLGVDGGPGTLDLCAPLWLRLDAFGLTASAEATVRIRVTLVVPDQDLTRVHAEVRGDVRSEGTARSLSGEAEVAVSSSIATLVEPLRGLGGESSTAILEVEVDCKLKSE